MIRQILRYKKSLHYFFIVEEHYRTLAALKKIMTARDYDKTYTGDQRDEVLHRALYLSENTTKELINTYGFGDSVAFTKTLNNLLCVGRNIHTPYNSFARNSQDLNATIIKLTNDMLKIVSKKKVNIV
jgi:hypothetical protein